MKKNQKSIYALGIVAHPDDESFLLAGTSLKLAEEGKEMAILSATCGEKGADRLNRKLSKTQMANIRVTECRKAAKIIKLAGVEFFNYPDGGLEQVDFKELVGKLTKKIDQYKPSVIFTFGNEGVSGHKDHIVIGKAAVAASRQADHKPDKILLASIPASEIKAFNKHLLTRKVHHAHFMPQVLKGIADEKLLKIDIRKYAKQKHLALKTHESQYLPAFVLDILQKQECFEIIELKNKKG